MLRLARVQSGRERIVVEEVGVRDALAPAWARHIEPLAARGIRAALDIPRDVLVRADRAMLGVVLDNLCANAAEHTHAGGDVLAECLMPDELCVTLRISNTRAPGGHRVPAAAAHHADQPAAIHAGLGLSIARSMGEALGGSLDTADSNGRFSVTLTLPRAPR